MNGRPVRRRLSRVARAVAAAALAGGLAGCGSTGSGQSGSTFVFLTVNRVSPAAANSSLDDPATSTTVCVTFANNLKNPTVTAPTGLDSVIIQSYTVSFTPLPSTGTAPDPVTINTSFTVPAGAISGTPPQATGNTVTVPVVVVPAEAKRRAPLSNPRPRLPVTTVADLNFRGRDGRGQRLEVQASVVVNFIAGVEAESVPTCS